MNKFKNKQKRRKTKQDKSKIDAYKNDGEKPKNQSSDTALVKFDPFQRYLSEISEHKLLTREQEIELGKRVMEDGDSEAAYILVTANLRLVVKMTL